MDKIINRYIKKFIIVSEPLFCEEKNGMVNNEMEYHWYNNDGGYGTVRINIEDKTWNVDGAIRTIQDACASGDYGTSE